MKKLLFLFAIGAICTTNGHAQITYHDISPDTTVNTWNAFLIYPSGPSSNLVIWFHPSPEVVVQTGGPCEVLFDAIATYPAKLQAGDSVSVTGNWHTANYDPLNSGTTGNWLTAATDKYLGFRFKTTATATTWNYGWLKMTVASGGTSFTVEEWAYNSTTGKSIKAGQMNTTGVNNVSNDHIAMYLNNSKIYFTNLDAGVKYPVSIVDMNGRLIQKADVTANEGIDISSLAKGSYIAQVNINGLVHNFRVPL